MGMPVGHGLPDAEPYDGFGIGEWLFRHHIKNKSYMEVGEII